MPEGLNYILTWLFGYPLLCHACFISSEIIICSSNYKLPVTLISVNDFVLEGVAYFPVVYDFFKFQATLTFVQSFIGL